MTVLSIDMGLDFRAFGVSLRRVEALVCFVGRSMKPTARKNMRFMPSGVNTAVPIGTTFQATQPGQQSF